MLWTRRLFPLPSLAACLAQWVREVILDRKSERCTEEEADRILDRAIESAVLLQERAGLDEITDGEWRRWGP